MPFGLSPFAALASLAGTLITTAAGVHYYRQRQASAPRLVTITDPASLIGASTPVMAGGASGGLAFLTELANSIKLGSTSTGTATTNPIQVAFDTLTGITPGPQSNTIPLSLQPPAFNPTGTAVPGALTPPSIQPLPTSLPLPAVPPATVVPSTPAIPHSAPSPASAVVTPTNPAVPPIGESVATPVTIFPPRGKGKLKAPPSNPQHEGGG